MFQKAFVPISTMMQRRKFNNKAHEKVLDKEETMFSKKIKRTSEKWVLFPSEASNLKVAPEK